MGKSQREKITTMYGMHGGKVECMKESKAYTKHTYTEHIHREGGGGGGGGRQGGVCVGVVCGGGVVVWKQACGGGGGGRCVCV